MENFRQKFFIFSFFVLIFFIFFVVIYMLLPFWQPLVLALISGVVFYPIHRFFKKFLFSDLVSAFLTLVVVFTFVIFPLSVAIFVFGQELTRLIENLNDYYRSGKLELLLEDLRTKLELYLYSLQSKYPFLENFLNIENLKGITKTIYSNLSGWLTKFTKEVVFWVSNAVFGTFIYLLTLFFALYQGQNAIKHIKRVIPLEDKDKEEILRTLKDAITGVIYGTAGTALIQSIIALGLYLYYGLSYPFLWALITAIFAFIPPFGTGYVWFPITLYEFFTGNTLKGIVGLVVGFLVISSIDNFVRPLVMKEKIELPYVVLFFSVIGGLFTFGFAGLFLGPTIFALFITLVKIYERKFAIPGGNQSNG
jgi:predicted PurR-regulated permease PerM